MKVLLTAIFLSTIIGFVLTDSEVMSEFEMAEISPDIVKKSPRELLEVNYEGKIVELGNEFTPIEAMDMPQIHYKRQCNAFYTLVMMDPDVVGLGVNRELVHWLVGNIPGEKVSKGIELVKYDGPHPSPNSGLHRYIFLVFEQKQGAILFEEEYLSREQVTERKQFSIKNFTKKYNLGKPRFGNFFRAQAQSSCL